VTPDSSVLKSIIADYMASEDFTGLRDRSYPTVGGGLHAARDGNLHRMVAQGTFK
jgi:hypothetical protein